MHINYINDRQKLGFNCIKDINAIKQFKSTLKNPVTWIIRKGKQTIILLFSKEVLVAVFIQSTQVNLDADFYHQSFACSEVCQCCVIKWDTSVLLTSPTSLDYYIHN
jgi:hypothetical protein